MQTISQEQMAQLVRAELQRLEQEKKESRNMYQRICKDFAGRYAKYDYKTQHWVYPVNGDRELFTNSCDMRWKVQNAIGTLLRAIYRVNATAKLPVNKEPEIRQFISKVLELMELAEK